MRSQFWVAGREQTDGDRTLDSALSRQSSPRYFRKTNRSQTKMSGPSPGALPRGCQGCRETWRRQSEQEASLGDTGDVSNAGEDVGGYSMFLGPERAEI